MPTTPIRAARAAALTLAATLAATAAAQAATITIDFESETQERKPDGFVTDDTPLAIFSVDRDPNSLGDDLDLRVEDFGVGNFGLPQSNGIGLGVFPDDRSKLVIDFTQPVTNLSIGFGNDDPFTAATVRDAVLQGFHAGVQVGESKTPANRNDGLDQFATLPDAVIDRAVFFYADGTGAPVGLIEVVDDISFDLASGQKPSVVPVPMALPLLASALGLVGALRATRRRPAA